MSVLWIGIFGWLMYDTIALEMWKVPPFWVGAAIGALLMDLLLGFLIRSQKNLIDLQSKVILAAYAILQEEGILTEDETDDVDPE